MPSFACLISGQFNHELDGEITGVGLSGVKYVFAAHLVAAKKKSVTKVVDELKGWEGVSDISVIADQVQEVPLWALISKVAFFTWRLDAPDQHKQKLDALRETRKFHRYFS